jgi:hypothetical protein
MDGRATPSSFDAQARPGWFLAEPQHSSPHVVGNKIGQLLTPYHSTHSHTQPCAALPPLIGDRPTGHSGPLGARISKAHLPDMVLPFTHGQYPTPRVGSVSTGPDWPDRRGEALHRRSMRRHVGASCKLQAASREGRRPRGRGPRGGRTIGATDEGIRSSPSGT